MSWPSLLVNTSYILIPQDQTTRFWHVEISLWKRRFQLHLLWSLYLIEYLPTERKRKKAKQYSMGRSHELSIIDFVVEAELVYLSLCRHFTTCSYIYHLFHRTLFHKLNVARHDMLHFDFNVN